MIIKYLGVTFSSDLKWGTHIHAVIKKANQKLGFLKRNLRGAPMNSKQTAYFSIVRSGLEYASPIWDPYQKGDIDDIQFVQRTAARWVKSVYTRKPGVVTKLLKELKWPPLADRRRDLKLTLLFKIYKGDVALTLDSFNIKFSERATKAASVITEDGSVISYKLDSIEAKKAPLRNSTIPTTITLWNKTPGCILSSSTTDILSVL